MPNILLFGFAEFVVERPESQLDEVMSDVDSGWVSLS